MRTAAPPRLGNADYPWDLFDSDYYLQHNYGTLHDLDRAIIERLAGFFASRLPAGQKWHGIDVGSGTNLYPALSMLPLTRTITLWEYSQANVRWLEHGLQPNGQQWDQFWHALETSHEVYRRFRRPRVELRDRARVKQASVFDLPSREWDIGTMFFVAESITGRRDEFEEATRRFVGSLKPGAPFVAAFMRNSRGYTVGEHQFPAVAITEVDLRRLLRTSAVDLEVHRIDSEQRFREGYEGMVLVTGTRRRESGSGRRGQTRVLR